MTYYRHEGGSVTNLVATDDWAAEFGQEILLRDDLAVPTPRAGVAVLEVVAAAFGAVVVQCSWCTRVLWLKPDAKAADDPGTSHTVCGPCAAKFREERL